MVQFTEWLVNRYLLSPHLVELVIVILALLLPSVFIIAYCHGKPGRDRWGKPEKIGVPVNVIIMVFLVFFLFSKKDLSPVSQKVTLEDETGKKIERTIPKTGFRKKILLFTFENETGDTSLDWLQDGISYMIHYDLLQDLFIEVSTLYELDFELNYYIYDKIKDAGYKKRTGLPLLLKKKITKESHMDYFLSGSISKEEGEYILESVLYRTKNAKPAARETVRGKDIFQLIDRMSVKLKYALEIPKVHIEDVIDLPMAELFTNSPAAARLFTLGCNAQVFEKDWTKAQHYFEQAIREDPTFAAGHGALANIYSLTNQSQKWIDAYQPLMQHSYKLPERFQFYAKFGYYTTKQDPDKQLAVVKMIIKLYPEDLRAHSILILLLVAQNRLDEAIATYNRMLEIDPERYEIFEKIGDLYQQKGDTGRALDYYKKYARHFPGNPVSFNLIGGLYRQMGNHEQAKEYYEKALLLKPDDIDVLIELAGIETDLGHMDKASEQFRELLRLSKTAKDRTKAYKAFADFCFRKGQVKKDLEYVKLSNQAMAEYALPYLVMINKIFTMDSYVYAGKEKEAFQVLAALESELKPPYSKFLSLGYLMVYLALEKPDEAEKSLVGIRDIITSFGIDVYQALIYKGEGDIHRMRGEYAEAIKSYQTALKERPDAKSILRRIGRCYRHLKQYQKAEESILETLKTKPLSPLSHYELALVYLDSGDKEKAEKHLKIAADIWKDADPIYKPAQSVREKLAELRNG
jgi:tetratricopeptide (TPR) repeat protein